METQTTTTTPNTMEGHCLCKAISIKVTDDELFTRRRGHLCHCANCRKVAGGLFGTNLIIEDTKVEWLSGRDFVKEYKDHETLSGIPVSRWFCPTCGVPIMSTTPKYKGKTILKLGIYPRIPEPEWESFTDHRHEWHKPMHEDMAQYKIASLGEKQPGSK